MPPEAQWRATGVISTNAAAKSPSKTSKSYAAFLEFMLMIVQMSFLHKIICLQCSELLGTAASSGHEQCGYFPAGIGLQATEKYPC